MSNIIKGYSDGACKGNPGPGGWGCAIIRDNLVYVDKGGAQHTTNQQMELLGALNLLKMVDDLGIDSATLYLDSTYVLNGIISGGKSGILMSTGIKVKRPNFTGWLKGWMNNSWMTSTGTEVKNKELWQSIVDTCETLIRKDVELNFKWIKGHSGEYGNDLVDELANAGIPC